MTDTQVANAEPAKRKLADHAYVNAANAKVAIAEGTGIQYKSLADAWEFGWQIPGASAGSPQTMVALFGARTLSINETSAARQNDQDQLAALNSRFGDLANGVWREHAEGAVRGPKFDKDILAVCIVESLGDAAKGDAEYYRAKLGTESDTEEQASAARKYYAKIRTKTKIMAAYYTALGRDQDDTDIA